MSSPPNDELSLSKGEPLLIKGMELPPRSESSPKPPKDEPPLNPGNPPKGEPPKGDPPLIPGNPPRGEPPKGEPLPNPGKPLNGEPPKGDPPKGKPLRNGDPLFDETDVKDAPPVTCEPGLPPNGNRPLGRIPLLIRNW